MTRLTQEPTHTAPPPFEEHLRETVSDMRAALIALMTAVGADPNRPREAARHIGLRVGLAWKACKIVQEADVCSAAPHIPGPTGLKLLLDAFQKAGAPQASVSAAKAAGKAFDRMVEIHTGDRQTLLTMLGQLSPIAQRAQREADRKIAFQGSSSTWGVQARLNFSAQFVAPNPEAPEMVDIASVSGLFDFRRLRRTPNWVLQQFRSYNDDGSVRRDERIPIDPSVSHDDGLPLMHDFCVNLPEIREARTRDGIQIELADGPVGHTAAFTCVIGSFDRKFACWHRDEANKFGEYSAPLFTPSEALIADVFVHRDLPFELPPEPHLFSCLFASGDSISARGDAHRMPLSEPVHELAMPSGVTTPHFPRYMELMQAVCDRLEWSVGDFRAYRFLMPYPPIPTLFALRHPLPEPPA